MSALGAGRRWRVVRGAFRPRGVRWERLETGSTNALWRGRACGGDWLLKWYRYPEAGVHPEVEVAEFLGGQRGVGVARFGGALERQRGDGLWESVALVQGWVEGRGAWERMGEALREGRERVADAWALGRCVGEVHRALASGEAGGAFGRDAWGTEDARAWSDSVLALGERLQEAVHGGAPEGVDGGGWTRLRSLWGAGDWRERARGLARLEVTGWKTRIHGDLHLGQILEQPGREPVIVDWEGEPLRPLEERRRKELALRDVAGMWRSYAYAGAVFGAEAERVGELQRAFVQGWRECVELPGGDWLGVLEGMIWEKTIYEALYELRHRPGWLGVPVQALECPAGRGLAGLR